MRIYTKIAYKATRTCTFVLFADGMCIYFFTTQLGIIEKLKECDAYIGEMYIYEYI